VAVPLPTAVAPSKIVTVVPASAVPVNVGVVLVAALEVTGVEGAAGAVVSIVTLKALEATERLPAGSVCLAVMLCTPSLRLLVVIVALVELATTEPTAVPPSKMVTVLADATDPMVNVGVLLLVMLSVVEVPVSVAAVRSGVPGAARAAVSMVTLRPVKAAETFPATSVAFAVIV